MIRNHEYNDDSIEFFDSFNGDQVDNVMPEIVVPSEKKVDEFDQIVNDLDFSSFAGSSFKKSLKKVNYKIREKQSAPANKRIPLAKRRPMKPLDKTFGVETKATIHGGFKKMGRVIVPNNRPVIIEGVDRFILSDNPADNALRSIGYWNGKKLNELVMTFNNNSAIDFNLSLFNPSMPLDYLQSTGQNLNDKIEVGGGAISYSDLLFNIVGNPILVRNCKFVISGPQASAQQAVALRVQDKYVNGVTEVIPMNLSLQIDTMQVEGNTISFDISRTINRPFIPDGMDVIGYNVLAGNTVTMCFYYEQKSLKKLFYPEARIKKRRLM
jgi:hypothetical protein